MEKKEMTRKKFYVMPLTELVQVLSESMMTPGSVTFTGNYEDREDIIEGDPNFGSDDDGKGAKGLWDNGGMGSNGMWND